MARKTNKTDHVLNLLSSGKKSGKEENDAPPVDLRRKAPEPPEEEFSEEFSEEGLPEPRMTQREEEPLPEPRVADRRGEEPLPEPKMSAGSEEIQPSLVGVAAVAPSVSVVHASDGEDPIAEAVKESLEAEFDDFLREKNESKESTGINVFELLGADAEDGPETKEEPETQSEEAAAEIAVQEPQEMPEAVKAEAVPEPSAEEDVKAPEDVISAKTGSVEAFSEEKAPEPVKETAEEHEPVKTTEPERPAEQVVSVQPERPAEQVVSAKPESPTEQVVSAELGNSAEQAVSAGPEEPAEEAAAPEPESLPVEEASAEIIPEEAQEQAAPEEQPETGAAQQKEEDMQQSKEEEKDYIMVNVMEYLVRDQVPRYVRQFGHCDCDRCLEDTIALTLTHLPSKYVVVNKNAVSPLLNFYEKKYAGQLIVEITKATMIVNESPHH